MGVLRGLATAYTDPTHDLPVHDNQQTALEGYGVRVGQDRILPTVKGIFESFCRPLECHRGSSLPDREIRACEQCPVSPLEVDQMASIINDSNVQVPFVLPGFSWDGRHISGDAPSKEAFLHRSMYEERSGAGAIVHLHSTHSAAVSCMDGLDCADCLPPLTAYYVMKIGRLPLIPYHRPGDASLGTAIRGLAGRHSALLLANHGPVVSGTTLEAAVYATEELEETAKLFLLLRSVPSRPLNREQIDELKTAFKLDS